MKDLFRRIFSPLLAIFESGEGEYKYERTHRIALVVLGLIFSGLGTAVLVLSVLFAQAGALIAAVFFLGIGITSLVIGGIGSDRAVAKIWGNS